MPLMMRFGEENCLPSGAVPRVLAEQGTMLGNVPAASSAVFRMVRRHQPRNQARRSCGPLHRWRHDVPGRRSTRSPLDDPRSRREPSPMPEHGLPRVRRLEVRAVFPRIAMAQSSAGRTRLGHKHGRRIVDCQKTLRIPGILPGENLDGGFLYPGEFGREIQLALGLHQARDRSTIKSRPPGMRWRTHAMPFRGSQSSRAMPAVERDRCHAPD